MRCHFCMSHFQKPNASLIPCKHSTWQNPFVSHLVDSCRHVTSFSCVGTIRSVLLKQIVLTSGGLPVVRLLGQMGLRKRPCTLLSRVLPRPQATLSSPLLTSCCTCCPCCVWHGHHCHCLQNRVTGYRSWAAHKCPRPPKPHLNLLQQPFLCQGRAQILGTESSVGSRACLFAGNSVSPWRSGLRHGEHRRPSGQVRQLRRANPSPVLLFSVGASPTFWSAHWDPTSLFGQQAAILRTTRRNPDLTLPYIEQRPASGVAVASRGCKRVSLGSSFSSTIRLK